MRPTYHVHCNSVGQASDVKGSWGLIRGNVTNLCWALDFVISWPSILYLVSMRQAINCFVAGINAAPVRCVSNVMIASSG